MFHDHEIIDHHAKKHLSQKSVWVCHRGDGLLVSWFKFILIRHLKVFANIFDITSTFILYSDLDLLWLSICGVLQP
jgi:hypothetical protein